MCNGFVERLLPIFRAHTYKHTLGNYSPEETAGLSAILSLLATALQQVVSGTSCKLHSVGSSQRPKLLSCFKLSGHCRSPGEGGGVRLRPETSVCVMEEGMQSLLYQKDVTFQRCHLPFQLPIERRIEA